MSWAFKLLICSLKWTSSDTTGHDTGLGTGLSLASESCACFDFAAAFRFDGMNDFVKGWRDNDIWCHNLANCRMTTTILCTFMGGRDATVALLAWIVLALYWIVEAPWELVSIRSSTVVNRSSAVMSRCGSVYESRRHRRTPYWCWIFFFSIPTHPDFTIWLKSGWINGIVTMKLGLKC